MANDTWQARDLPVIEAIVELIDEGLWYVEPKHIIERTGMTPETVQLALFALAREYPPFFEYSDASTYDGPEIAAVHSVTGHARRTVGAWPTPEALADRLVQAMERAAEAEPDDEKRGWLRKIATHLGTAGHDVLVGVTASMITKGVGVG